LRRFAERVDADDLPILGMLAHGVGASEVATTLGLQPEWVEARRWAMLAGGRRRSPLAAA
jgi:hypothetical protein